MPLPSTSKPRPSNAIQGSLPPTAQSRRDLARLDKTPNFMLKFHPARWMYVELPKCGECAGCKHNSKVEREAAKAFESIDPDRLKPCVNDDRGEFLPLLSKLKLDGGVGGCDYSVSRGYNIKDALHNARVQGYTVLEPSKVGLEYVRVYDCVGGGKAHLSMWETVIPSPGQKPAVIVADTVAYHDWLRSLIADGIIPQIDTMTAESMIESLRGKLARGTARRANDPGLDLRMRHDERRLRGMVATARAIAYA
tara:strand:- start:285 stop:1040 length:756 start_codon:yes stop_codon:yes gene_type:complete